MTNYIVFSPNGDGGWQEYGRAEARSTGSAIRQVVAEHPELVSGQLVAVPERSWRPVKVEVETKTRLKFS